MKIAVLPGDGIGTEIVAQALRVLQCLDLKFETEQALVGGAAYEAFGHPLPPATLELAKSADAVLFGAADLRTVILAGFWVDPAYGDEGNPQKLDQTIRALRRLNRNVILIGAVPQQPFTGTFQGAGPASASSLRASRRGR